MRSDKYIEGMLASLKDSGVDKEAFIKKAYELNDSSLVKTAGYVSQVPVKEKTAVFRRAYDAVKSGLNRVGRATGVSHYRTGKQYQNRSVRRAENLKNQSGFDPEMQRIVELDNARRADPVIREGKRRMRNTALIGGGTAAATYGGHRYLSNRGGDKDINQPQQRNFQPQRPSRV